jgi:hypothetical protein
MSAGTMRKELGSHRRSVHPGVEVCDECREKRERLLALRRASRSRLTGRPIEAVRPSRIDRTSAARAFLDEVWR